MPCKSFVVLSTHFFSQFFEELFSNSMRIKSVPGNKQAVSVSLVALDNSDTRIQQNCTTSVITNMHDR